MDTNSWYKNAVFYEVNVRAFCDSNADGYGDLPGLMHKLDYLKKLGVDCLWLMPLYLSPLLDSGYDIADFYSIHPDYGTLDDFKALLDGAHQRGIRVITDLVLNHTSYQHPWFKEARSDPSSPYRDYYVWSDTDQKYDQARIIFLDYEKSNWTWDETAGQYYWHRFFSSQPDLNYDNPALREEMLNIVKFWLDLGVDGFRADAVPYLYEREGTNCENLPETHAFLKELRRFVDQHYPDRVLLCEANQWPVDVRPYFGESDECHMAFHFPLMPRIFMALRQEDVSPVIWVMNRTPSIPEDCQWCTFLRNHDELTLEMVTEEDRQWMWEQYAPDPRMRSNLGIRRRLAPLLDNDRRKILLANSLLFTMPGSPILYYGDEIGMGDNFLLFDRNGLRTPMQWDASLNAGFSQADPARLYLPVIDDPTYGPEQVNVAAQWEDPDSLLSHIRRMIRVRRSYRTFGRGELTWLAGAPNNVAAYLRSYLGRHILVVNNLSPSPQSMLLQIPVVSSSSPVELLTETGLPEFHNGQLPVDLEPYQYLWLLL